LENGFQTPLRKLYAGDFYVSTISWTPLQKFTSLSKKKSFQKPQRHDPLGALAQTIVLMMLLHDSNYD
jgi:hypothetical protein